MKKILGLSLCATLVTGIYAIDLPLKEVTIFSSGLAYFEHESEVSGSCNFDFSFEEDQLNDFLKSLTISDAGAKNISLDYSSANTLEKTLASLSIDLSKRPSMYQLLKKQIGSELSFTVLQGAEKYIADGRILSVDRSGVKENTDSADVLISVLTEEGVRVFNLKNVLSFKFKDTEKNASLIKALKVLDAESTSSRQKKISVHIEGNGKRRIKLSYVLGAPVWKTTYRLILGNETAVFQAWAIVDNSTDLDWQSVRLNLITGKPVSFRQKLYEPYYVTRPLLPLPVESAAELEMYDSAVTKEELAEANLAPAEYGRMLMKKENKMRLSSDGKPEAYLEEEVFSGEASVLADSKFVFTPKDPINLARQKSTMIPLKVTTLPAKKMTVFSSLENKAKHPKLCVELRNNSGMNLPAGAITLYDDGYSGDSMIDFLPKEEKRLISYGDDLLLSGLCQNKNEQSITKLSAKDGVLKVEIERRYISEYTFINSDVKERSIILEHPITRSELYETTKPIEKTLNAYRFGVACPARKSSTFTVKEKCSVYNKYSLINNSFTADVLDYIENGKAPSNVVAIFKKISKEQATLDRLSQNLNDLQTKQRSLNDEQERTRKNMTALAKTTEVAAFTQKLLDLEKQISTIQTEIEHSQAEIKSKRDAFKDYLNSIEF